MTSKTAKQTTCMHKFTKGKKKGKKCGKVCRGKFCYNHKPAKLEYLANYHKEKKEEEETNGLSKIIKKIKEGKITDENPYTIEYSNAYGETKEILRKILGVQLILGDITDEDILNKYDKKINSKLYKEADKYVEECSEEHEYTPEEKEELREHYINRFRTFSFFPIHLPFYGNEKQAKRELKKLMKKHKNLMERMNNILLIKKEIREYLKKKE